ncbi:MAG: hypothetical protein JXA69_19725 [Phycisphaerae bacterium]|nr:hypothetical protein [Phycisphaerae bacterium]
MIMKNHRKYGWLILLCLPLYMGQACVSVSGDPDPEPEPADVPEPPPAFVLVQFLNESAYGVDIELYASATPITNPATELFVPGNRITGLGEFGTDIIRPDSAGSVEVRCTWAAAIGTLGGRFVDTEGQEIGRGRQRVASMGIGYECEDIITLRFRADGDEFTTDILFE